MLFPASLAFVVAAYLAAAIFHVAFGSMNVDEGFYAAATRAVWQGEVPYRDFGFTQPPVVIYANAPLLAALRFGLFEQRVVNAFWGVLALAVASQLVWKRTGRGGGLVLLAVFTLTPAWLYFVNLGKTYGLTAFLVMVMVSLLLQARVGWRKTAALSLVGVLGAASRLPAVPFFALLWMFSLWEGGWRGWRHLAVAFGCLLAAFSAVLLPFILVAPEQFWFWVVEFHRISVPQKEWGLAWNDIAGLAPAAWLLVLAAMIWLVVKRPQGVGLEISVLVASLAGVGVNLLPRGAYEEYAVPILPPLVAASLIILGPFWRRGLCWWRTGLVGLILLLSAGSIPLINWHKLQDAQKSFPSCWLPTNVPPYDFELARSIREGRAAIQQLLPSGQSFVGPAIMLAVEADRPIPRRFRMGAFTCTADYDEPRADRLHLATLQLFEQLVRDKEVPVIAMHEDIKFNFAWSVPSLAFQPAEFFVPLQEYIVNHFEPVWHDRYFLVLKRKPERWILFN